MLSAGLPAVDAPIAPWWLCCPALAALPAEHGELLLSAPGVDANGAVLGLVARQPGPWPGQVHVGVLAVDPFRRSEDLIRALLRAGARGVVNWPTVGLFDGQFGASLAAVGFDVSAELAFLREARAAGLQVMATVASVDAGRAALADGVDAVLVHPGWARRDPRLNEPLAAQARSTLQTLAALRRGARPALLLYRPEGFGALLDEAAACADGVIDRDAGADPG